MLFRGRSRCRLLSSSKWHYSVNALPNDAKTSVGGVCLASAQLCGVSNLGLPRAYYRLMRCAPQEQSDMSLF